MYNKQNTYYYNNKLMEYKIFGCKVNKYYTDKWLASEKLKGKT
jgi:hypothetical protein